LRLGIGIDISWNKEIKGTIISILEELKKIRDDFLKITKTLEATITKLEPDEEISKLKLWPEDWPKYKMTAYSDPCDMLVGPCCCGAWHIVGEFTLKHGYLYKDGKPCQN